MVFIFCREREEQKSAIIVGAIVCSIILLMFIVIVLLYCKKAKAKEATLHEMTMKMAGFDDNEPLRPTNIKPNMTKLRTVKEEEIKRHKLLGCGAFGTVFSGFWYPEGTSKPLPVAIKVLKGNGANTTREFLDEAYIMASVDHPHLLKLLAVCLGSQLMLITPLAPLGCLKDYCQANKKKIGSKTLLNWGLHIAKGTVGFCFIFYL